MATMRLTVNLNGTDTNPWHQYGLMQNPFPQIADARYEKQIRHLAKLGADPIPDTNYIRKHLEGWSKEFVDGCCERFRKGEMVTFNIQFEV